VKCTQVLTVKNSFAENSFFEYLCLNILWCTYTYLQSRAINFGRQGHSLTQSKMLHCKTVVNIESVFKFIDGSIGGISFLPKRYITVRFMLSLRKDVSLFTKNFMLGSTKIHLSQLQWELVVWWTNSGGNVKIVCRSQTVNVKAKRGKNWKSATLFTYPLIFS
jgi:hypothetical protein